MKTLKTLKIPKELKISGKEFVRLYQEGYPEAVKKAKEILNSPSAKMIQKIHNMSEEEWMKAHDKFPKISAKEFIEALNKVHPKAVKEAKEIYKSAKKRSK